MTFSNRRFSMPRPSSWVLSDYAPPSYATTENACAQASRRRSYRAPYRFPSVPKHVPSLGRFAVAVEILGAVRYPSRRDPAASGIFIALCFQSFVFFATYLIDCLSQMLSDVKFVEHNLFLGLLEMVSYGVDVPIPPHFHRHRFNTPL